MIAASQIAMWARYNFISIIVSFSSAKIKLKKFFIDKDFRKALRISNSLRLSPALFDSDDYLSRYPDVANAQADPFKHFMTFGYPEGREGRFFDNFWYLARYRDVARLTANGHDHYRRYGTAEGRDVRYISLRQTFVDKRSASYQTWLYAHDKEIHLPNEIQKTKIELFNYRPLFSVVMPVYNPPIQYLDAAINSVLNQSYENWELCIADDASSDPKIKDLLVTYAQKDSRIKVCVRTKNGHISAASNSALELAAGEYIALLDHDDLLAEDALFWVADAINRHPEADILFSDEDKISEDGIRYDPYFKPDFNYELFLAQNMINHLGIYKRSIVSQVGGFRLGYEGSQDHDLALRVMEHTNRESIYHIPRILYHWRAVAGSTANDAGEKSYASESGLKAVKDHLNRTNSKGEVTIPYPKIGHYRVKYELPFELPLITIIIPTRDRVNLLKQCISSIIDITTYSPYEILIIDNGSTDGKTLEYFDEIKCDNIRVIRDDSDFNYPALNNLGVKAARGDFVVLMNNDIEIITPDWLEEMLRWGQRPDIGCVGARLWYPNYTLQHGGVVLGIGGVAGHAHKHIAKNDFGYFCRAVHHQEFSAVTAACLLVKKSTYLEVGGLDTRLSVAFNDVDFCLRVRAAGLRNIWTPYAQMFHHESASRGHEDTPEKIARFKKESEFMRERWADTLDLDTNYNPNLTLEHEDFSFAWPPRLDMNR